ncbi:DUF1934 domain-containing protein [Lacticaseibacillus nasuensis]|uniref:DUF1934 domain-containing protein n=1 Tax=Lacticaseibacillus nasuensis JCM 17158 TaxID=1291734 RepID=A0A0R1JHF1_9LACO|nr:DUF1934 domain-containing protein [Lacticaseibacillus nasuensis]KRK70427.1 hypothetical protein FD02_GL000492 [Lacticaseibacillus nasuensis JCM 17158]MCX2454523.1 DUF1934 domain-containing protein [Lacticaseibacillus nasuensis]
MDLAHGIPITLHLETYVTQDDGTEKHVFDEPGTLVQLGDTLYIRYREIDEAAGTDYPVTMKLRGDGDIQLTRGGSADDTQLKLHFANERRVLTRYRTPYGIIPVETITPRLDVRLTDSPLAGEIYVEYQLNANGAHLGDYRLRLLFTA